jgi:hypothetical protein
MPLQGQWLSPKIRDEQTRRETSTLLRYITHPTAPEDKPPSLLPVCLINPRQSTTPLLPTPLLVPNLLCSRRCSTNTLSASPLKLTTLPLPRLTTWRRWAMLLPPTGNLSPTNRPVLQRCIPPTSTLPPLNMPLPNTPPPVSTENSTVGGRVAVVATPQCMVPTNPTNPPLLGTGSPPTLLALPTISAGHTPRPFRGQLELFFVTTGESVDCRLSDGRRRLSLHPHLCRSILLLLLSPPLPPRSVR